MYLISVITIGLGGFHLLMSALGRIGPLMDGSGLTDALETSYAANAVVHMMTGKAILRSLRGHFLVEAALKSRLLQPLIPAQRLRKKAVINI